MSSRIATLLMDEMRPDPWRKVRLPTATLVATGSPMIVTQGVRDVCDALGWTISIRDAEGVNLNDVREHRSPLAVSIRHAADSQSDWLYVLRGANRKLLDDDHCAAMLDQWGRSARLIVLTDELGHGQSDWSRVRID